MWSSVATGTFNGSSVFIHSPFPQAMDCSRGGSLETDQNVVQCPVMAARRLVLGLGNSSDSRAAVFDVSVILLAPLIFFAAEIRHTASARPFRCGRLSQLLLIARRSESPHSMAWVSAT